MATKITTRATIIGTCSSRHSTFENELKAASCERCHHNYLQSGVSKEPSTAACQKCRVYTFISCRICWACGYGVYFENIRDLRADEAKCHECRMPLDSSTQLVWETRQYVPMKRTDVVRTRGGSKRINPKGRWIVLIVIWRGLTNRSGRRSWRRILRGRHTESGTVMAGLRS